MNTFLRMREISDSLRDFGRQHPEVAVIYLFGSQTSGQAGPLSDLDVAVLLDESPATRHRPFMSHLHLISEVMHTCRKFDVDVVVLNEATPLLTYEVIRGGRLLYEADHDQRVCYESYISSRALDLKAFFEITST